MVADANGTLIDNAVIDIETQAMEYGRPVMLLSGQSDAQGSFAWQQQFFDGARQRIMVNVAPDPNSNAPFELFALAEQIEVEGIALLILTRLIGLATSRPF